MKQLFAALAATMLVGATMAQTSAPAAASAPAASGSAAPSAESRVDHQIKRLHDKLKITSAEETQWGAVAQAMRDNATDLDGLIQKRAGSAETATAIDDLNAYGAIAQAHADGVKKLSAAFAPLYASFSDDQKKLADVAFTARPHRGGHRKTAAKAQ